MKRTITIVQRRGMEQVMAVKAKRGASPECMVCRHSRTQIIEGRFIVCCKLDYPLMIAETCPNFRDSRVALSVNYLHGIGANG